MTTPLLEITFSDTPQVDREAGVIRGVKILGRTSRNHRVYTDAALNQAAYLYEGLAVNLDHPVPSQAGAGRAVAEGFGWLTSVGVREAGVFGDLHYLRSHPQAEMIAEAAERNPRRFGLSHNAVGQVRHRDGQCIVEAIDKVHSVDIVQNPATSSGLFESETSMTPTLPESQAPPTPEPCGPSACSPAASAPSSLAPVTLSQLCEQVQWAPLLDHPLLAVMRSRTLAPPADPATARDTIVQSIVYALAEAYDRYHTHEYADLFAHLTRQLAPGQTGAAEGPALTESRGPIAESSGAFSGMSPATSAAASLAERVSQLETESVCRGLLEELNRTADRPRLTALARLATEADRRQLIDSWPARETNPRPRPASSPPLSPRGEPLDKLPEDVRGFVAALR
jgi:hypothetical protein